MGTPSVDASDALPAQGPGSGTHLSQAPADVLHVGATPWRLERRTVAGPRYQRALERCLGEAALVAGAHGALALQLAVARPAPVLVALTVAGDALAAPPASVAATPRVLRGGAVALAPESERARAVTLRHRRLPERPSDREVPFEASLVARDYHDFARRWLFDGDVFLGSILLGRRLESPFTTEDLARIDDVADQWVVRLREAMDRDASRLGPSAAVVLSDSQEPTHVSSGAEAWLGAVGSKRLATALPLGVGAIGPAAAFVDGVRADARELWRDGRRSFLVTLRPMEPVTIHPAAALTERQREVAACARNGAKAAAIAEALDISVHTARQHLQAVYRALGVSNRVELRMALDDLDSLGLDQSPSAAR